MSIVVIKAVSARANILNMLLPITLPTASDLNPLNAATTLAANSGSEVPIAITSIAIRNSGIPNIKDNSRTELITRTEPRTTTMPPTQARTRAIMESLVFIFPIKILMWVIGLWVCCLPIMKPKKNKKAAIIIRPPIKSIPTRRIAANRNVINAMK